MAGRVVKRARIEAGGVRMPSGSSFRYPGKNSQVFNRYKILGNRGFFISFQILSGLGYVGRSRSGIVMIQFPSFCDTFGSHVAGGDSMPDATFDFAWCNAFKSA
jgi:hypothetical protein